MFPPFEPTEFLTYSPCARLGWTRPVRTGDRHDAASPTHARRHAGPESVPTDATVVRAASLPIRTAFREIPGAVGTGGHSELSGVPDQREEAGPRVDRDRRVRPPIPVPGDVEEGLARPRRDSRAEGATDLARGPQPRGGPSLSRLCREPQASHDPDDLLRRRAAHLRGPCADESGD